MKDTPPDIKRKWSRFDNLQDPFNPNNYLSGWICTGQGDYYGRMVILQVNQEPTIQTIYSIPKMHYPYDKNDKFLFEYTKHDSYAYIKYDGTAIISYCYYYDNKPYVTYKTRLSPVLRSSKYGDFYTMWKEMLIKYPMIPQITLKDEVNLCFELCGIINKHLILYPYRLDTILLFGLNRHTGKVYLPNYEKHLTMAKLYDTIRTVERYADKYIKFQSDIEASNNIISDTEIEGNEGLVLYTKIDDEIRQFKCKPKSVLAVHQKASISKNDIMITCYNALETTDLDNLTYEIVFKLLKEEFTEKELMTNELRIKRILLEVIEEIKLRHNVIDIYTSLNLNIIKNKNSTMKTLSKYFKSNKMRWVFTILQAYEEK